MEVSHVAGFSFVDMLRKDETLTYANTANVKQDDLGPG